MDRNRNTTGSNNEEKNENEKYKELDQNNKVEDTKNKNIVGGQIIKWLKTITKYDILKLKLRNVK